MATTPNRNWPTPDDTDLVRDGASAIRALGDAIDGTVGQGFVYAGTRYYTSSGQFEKADPLGTGDIGLRAIRVRMVGGGGGGGGAATTGASEVAAGGSAGGGCYAESFITDIAGLSASEDVIRGAGGTGGVDGGNGSVGGTSSMASVSAGGGDNGFAGPASTTGGRTGTNGDGGGTGTGDLVIHGNAGGGQRQETLSSILSSVASPNGGGSHLGGSQRGLLTTGANGLDGRIHGGGGTGAGNRNNQSTARSGGNGANGIVIIDCFV